MSTLSKTCARFIKHLLEGVVLLVVLAGVVALVLMLTIDDQLSRRAETAMEAMLPGFEVSIGSATRVEGRGLLFRDVRIYATVEQRSDTDAADEIGTVKPRTAPELSIFSGFSLQRRQRHHPIVEVEQLQLACPTDWELLLTNQVLIDEIHLQHPILRKRHLLDGRDSLDAIIAAVSQHSGGTSIAPRKIRIESGTIEMFDPHQYPIDPDDIGVSRWSINDVSLDLTQVTEETLDVVLASDTVTQTSPASESASSSTVASTESAKSTNLVHDTAESESANLTVSSEAESSEAESANTESEKTDTESADSAVESAESQALSRGPSKWNAKLQFNTDFLKSASLEVDIDPQNASGTLRGEILALQLTESLFNVCDLPPAVQQTLSASIAGSCDLRLSVSLPTDGTLDWNLETRYRGFYRHPQCSQPFDHIDAACVLTPRQFDLQRFKAQWGAATVDCSGESQIRTERLQTLIAQSLQKYLPKSNVLPASDASPTSDISPTPDAKAATASEIASIQKSPLFTSDQTILQQVTDYLTTGLFQFQLMNLELSPELRSWLPLPQQKQWDSYQPSGMVHLQGSIQKQDDAWTPRFGATFTNLAFQDSRFPYRLHSGTGQASLTPEELSLELVAHAENRPVSIQGHLTHPLHHPAGSIRITAEKLPIDEPMFRAIPDSVEDSIRMLGLQGTFDIDSSFTYLGNGEKPQTEIVLNSGDIRLCYEKFPYEINHATANATFKNAVWNIDAIGYRGNQQLVGHVQIEPEYAESQVSASPTVAPPSTTSTPSIPSPSTQETTTTSTIASNTSTSGTSPIRYCITMQINGKEVALDDELRGALPETPRRIWEDLRPRGSANLSVAMTYHTGSKAPELQIVANQWSDTTTLEPISFPYRVDQIAGEFIYQNGSVQFRHFSAMHNSTRIQCDAEIFFSDNGSWSFAGKNLSVERLCFDSSLIQALPASLRSTIWSLRPTGAFQLRGGPSGVSFNHTPTDDGGTSWVAKWDLFIDSQGNSLHMGIPVENIFGSVRIHGSATTGYHLSHGEIDLDSLFCKGVQLTQVRGPFMIENERISFGTAIPNVTNTPFQQKIPGITPLASTAKSQSLAGATITLPDTAASLYSSSYTYPPIASEPIPSQDLAAPVPTTWNTSTQPEDSVLTRTAYALPLPAPPETTASSSRPTVPPPPTTAQTQVVAPWNRGTVSTSANGGTPSNGSTTSVNPPWTSATTVSNVPTNRPTPPTSTANPLVTNPALGTSTASLDHTLGTVGNTTSGNATVSASANASTAGTSSSATVPSNSSNVSGRVVSSSIGVVPTDGQLRLTSPQRSTNVNGPWNAPSSSSSVSTSPYVPTFDSSTLPFSTTPTARAVTAILAGGVLNCSGSIRTGDVLVYQLTVSLQNANLAWLIGTQLEGRQSIAGQLSLDARFAGDGASLGNLTGVGHLHLDNADIQSLPVVVSMVQKSSDSREKQTTFHSVDVDFEMRRSQIQMNHIELCGDTLSFLGNGYWILPSEIQLAFYSLIGRPDRQIPLVGPLLGDASRRLMEIQVSGTIDQPKIETQALPVLTAAIEQFQNSLQSNRRSP